MGDELPYKAEYAKSGRSSCKACKTSIEKDVLRLAVMVKSPHFDGTVPNWYHQICFFTKQRPKDISQIASFDNLKWDDQEKIRSKIGELSSGAVQEPVGKAKKGKATKRSKKDAAGDSGESNGDFCVEYAKSSRAMCRGCEVKIAKEEVRISKKDYESEDAKRYGGKDLWHHVECFAKLRSELEYWATGESLPGFKSLKKEDQAKVKSALPKIDKPADVKVKDEVDGEPSSKKVKKEPGENGVSADSKELKKQSDLLFKYVEKLKALKKKELHTLLEFNDQQVIQSGEYECRNQIADCLAFGGLAPCNVCGGQLLYKSGVGYQCTGDASEWTKCTHTESKPDRYKMTVPPELAEDYSFLKKYKPVTGIRIFVPAKPSTSSAVVASGSVDSVDSGPKVERFAPLRSMTFYIVGNVEKESLKREIVKLGGQVVSQLIDEVTAVISTPEAVEKRGAKMELAESLGIHVVPVEFIKDCKKEGCDVASIINKRSLVSWGQNLKKRIEDGRQKSGALMKSMKSKSQFTKSVPSKMTVKIKEGLVVDPDSGLQDSCHVHREGRDVWEAVLSKTDVESGQNSYYKIQLLAKDTGSKYYLFRSWGRIGTTIGGNKVENFGSLKEAKDSFRFQYQDKTGNNFENRHNFVKMPNGYYPVEISYSDDTISLKSDSSIPSKLPSPVQQLITLLFDTTLMKKVMMEFELDLEKMPLGKLSRRQLTTALTVLGRLQSLSGDIKPFEVKDASNQFYTLVPHDFGMQSPPLLDNAEIIKSKIEMVESLLEMEVAYSVLKESGGEGGDVHPVDHHYSKLKTEIEVVSETHEEFQIVEKYVRNTHATTHKNYELEITQLFKIKRQGEDKRFKPFKKLHNRKLLWHGSRLTNYVGILSQGLRIAPPEAPVTGYMFGKGIYFADMVSKSANYCMTSKDNSTGLLLLCEVALGDMYEKTQAEFIQALPGGKHSCKGIGVTGPDPSHSVHIEDGLEVPLGPPVTQTSHSSTSLLYNEYIVYDPAQVRAKYLLKVDFKYKY